MQRLHNLGEDRTFERGMSSPESKIFSHNEFPILIFSKIVLVVHVSAKKLMQEVKLDTSNYQYLVGIDLGETK